MISFSLQALTGMMLWLLARRAYRQEQVESVFLAGCITCFLFSAQQWMNFVYPFQVQFPMVYCFAVAALFSLWKSAEENWRPAWMAASICFAFLANYSMANGTLIWPVLLIEALWLKFSSRSIIALGSCAVLSLAGFFYRWQKSGQPTAPPGARLPRTLLFWLSHLGSPFLPVSVHGIQESTHVYLAAAAGTLLAAAVLGAFVSVWGRRREGNRAHAILVFCGVFLIITSGTIAYGRSGIGLSEMIFTSRYFTPSYLFWACVLLTFWPTLRRYSSKTYLALCIFLFFAVVMQQSDRLPDVRAMHATERLAEIAIANDVLDPEAWSALYHTPTDAQDAVQYLRNGKLTVFSEEWARWPGIALNRRFIIDRTPGACHGEIESASQVVQETVLKPGWRVTGWAWDDKDGRSPKYVILGDTAGAVAGVALTGFPPPPLIAPLDQRFVGQTWSGYVSGQSRSITAYVLESDDRSLCEIGKQQLRGSGTAATFPELGPPLPGSASPFTSAWTQDGYYKGPGGPGPPATGGLVFGSFPDENTGAIHLGPFQLDGHTEIGIPIITGPDNHQLVFAVRDATTKQVLSQLMPPPIRITWWVWHPDLPLGRVMQIELVAEDNGSAWGQWFAFGWPHTLPKK